MYFYSMLKWKKTSYMKKIQEIIIDLQKNAITRKNMILEKIRKKSIKFGVYTREKYQLQILIPN